MPGRIWIVCGALLGALAVSAGAFGAHALKGAKDSDGNDRYNFKQLENFETASRYLMYHALALLAVGMLPMGDSPCRCIAGGAFLLGAVLFCGGLYAWVFTQTKTFAMIVPFGGGAFIVGWIALAVAALRGA